MKKVECAPVVCPYCKNSPNGRALYEDMIFHCTICDRKSYVKIKIVNLTPDCELNKREHDWIGDRCTVCEKIKAAQQTVKGDKDGQQ